MEQAAGLRRGELNILYDQPLSRERLLAGFKGVQLRPRGVLAGVLVIAHLQRRLGVPNMRDGLDESVWGLVGRVYGFGRLHRLTRIAHFLHRCTRAACHHQQQQRHQIRTTSFAPIPVHVP